MLLTADQHPVSGSLHCGFVKSWQEPMCVLETWFFTILAVCLISDSMYDVLACIRQGKASLRKVEAPSLSPPRTSVNEQVLAAIRQGVQLKKVHPDAGAKPSKTSTSDLERSIKAALERIKKVSADSDDSDEQNPGAWDH